MYRNILSSGLGRKSNFGQDVAHRTGRKPKSCFQIIPQHLPAGGKSSPGQSKNCLPFRGWRQLADIDANNCGLDIGRWPKTCPGNGHHVRRISEILDRYAQQAHLSGRSGNPTGHLFLDDQGHAFRTRCVFQKAPKYQRGDLKGQAGDQQVLPISDEIGQSEIKYISSRDLYIRTARKLFFQYWDQPLVKLDRDYLRPVGHEFARDCSDPRSDFSSPTAGFNASGQDQSRYDFGVDQKILADLPFRPQPKTPYLGQQWGPQFFAPLVRRTFRAQGRKG